MNKTVGKLSERTLFSLIHHRKKLVLMTIFLQKQLRTCEKSMRSGPQCRTKGVPNFLFQILNPNSLYFNVVIFVWSTSWGAKAEKWPFLKKNFSTKFLVQIDTPLKQVCQSTRNIALFSLKRTKKRQSNEPLSIKIGQTVQKLEQSQFIHQILHPKSTTNFKTPKNPRNPD